MKTTLLIACFCVLSSAFSMDKDQKTYTKKMRDETMVYLPSGTLTMVTLMDKFPGLTEEKESVISVDGFFMSPYEISNFDYLEYLQYVRVNSDESTYKAALPDTNVWRRKLTYCEPYVEYYFRHPAYRHYPMVGITHKQATDYCVWLTKVYNEYPKRKYKKAVFRLPSKVEWYYAAVFRAPEKGEVAEPTTNYSTNGYMALFPWDGPYMQNEKGEWRANFRPIGQAGIKVVEGTFKNDTTEVKNTYMLATEGGGDFMGVAGQLNDAADVTAPVFSFGANSMGLFNMAGNVEEFVADYGFTKGGAWNDTGYYLRNDAEELYDSTNEATSSRGFRLAMTVLEEW